MISLCCFTFTRGLNTHDSRGIASHNYPAMMVQMLSFCLLLWSSMMMMMMLALDHDRPRIVSLTSPVLCWITCGLSLLWLSLRQGLPKFWVTRFVAFLPERVIWVTRLRRVCGGHNWSGKHRKFVGVFITELNAIVKVFQLMNCHFSRVRRFLSFLLSGIIFIVFSLKVRPFHGGLISHIASRLGLLSPRTCMLHAT